MSWATFRNPRKRTDCSLGTGSASERCLSRLNSDESEGERMSARGLAHFQSGRAGGLAPFPNGACPRLSFSCAGKVAFPISFFLIYSTLLTSKCARASSSTT